MKTRPRPLCAGADDGYAGRVYALTFHAIGDIRHEQVADPAVEAPGDAVVRVARTAICGSDMHPYHGRERGLDPGCVMGHEHIGEVVAVGAEVARIRPGQRVMCPFTTSCGSCFYCRRGLSARCERGQLFGWVEAGRGLHGAQAEYVRVPLADTTLVPIPEELSDDQALLMGDVLPTGYYCARRAELDPGGVQAVVGLGPVGLMAVWTARALGAERIFAIDSVPERLALAARFGATAVDYQAEDAAARVREASDGRGADAVMELVGSPAAAALAFDLVRPGGTVSMVGVHTEPRFAFSPAQAYGKNLTVRIGRCPARSLMPEVTAVLTRAAGTGVDPATIITHRLALTEGPRAYQMFDRKQQGCVKIVLSP
ncbi:alcohol dehydrogenase family protein [Haliangium sp.]|uniref:alcohol dehydrogenase family protein n=1 Tax=Haliangium sp. TaxID=2663208 RepID=UPI003D10A505